jgi:hypothetical protein
MKYIGLWLAILSAAVGCSQPPQKIQNRSLVQEASVPTNRDYLELTNEFKLTPVSVAPLATVGGVVSRVDFPMEGWLQLREVELEIAQAITIETKGKSHTDIKKQRN